MDIFDVSSPLFTGILFSTFFLATVLFWGYRFYISFKGDPILRGDANA